MKRMFVCVLILLVLSACSYWWPIDDGGLRYPNLPAGHPCNDPNIVVDPASCVPVVQPTLIYPCLPAGHPCNDPNVSVDPATCH